MRHTGGQHGRATGTDRCGGGHRVGLARRAVVPSQDVGAHAGRPGPHPPRERPAPAAPGGGSCRAGCHGRHRRRLPALRSRPVGVRHRCPDRVGSWDAPWYRPQAVGWWGAKWFRLIPSCSDRPAFLWGPAVPRHWRELGGLDRGDEASVRVVAPISDPPVGRGREFAVERSGGLHPIHCRLSEPEVVCHRPGH